MAQTKLRPIRMSDAETCFRWVSDPAVHRFLGLLQPARTLEQERSWIASTLTDKEHQRAFIIEDERGRPIGTCGLRGIDPDAGTALLGIMIGERTLWDKGYGTAAARRLLQYAFRDLGLHEVRLSCHRDNRRALRCYEKAGFQLISHERQKTVSRREEVRMSAQRKVWLARFGLDQDADRAATLVGGDEAERRAGGRGGHSSGECAR